jgi:hypothetical protein
LRPLFRHDLPLRETGEELVMGSVRRIGQHFWRKDEGYAVGQRNRAKL